MTDLAKCCPNVEVLAGIFKGEAAWENLLRARLGGYWQHLHTIPMSSEPAIVYYCKSALAFRSTLKSLHLVNKISSSNTKPVYLSHYDIITKQLKDFPKLENLETHSYTNKSIIELEGMIDDCPLLSNIKLRPLDL